MSEKLIKMGFEVRPRCRLVINCVKAFMTGRPFIIEGILTETNLRQMLFRLETKADGLYPFAPRRGENVDE